MSRRNRSLKRLFALLFGTILIISSLVTVSAENMEIVFDPGIQLDKVGEFQDDIVDDGFAQPGEKIKYTYTVENTGTIPLYNITLVDDVLGTIADGDPLLLPPIALNVVVFTAYYTLTAADIENGSVTNQATATGWFPCWQDLDMQVSRCLDIGDGDCDDDDGDCDDDDDGDCDDDDGDCDDDDDGDCDDDDGDCDDDDDDFGCSVSDDATCTVLLTPEPEDGDDDDDDDDDEERSSGDPDVDLVKTVDKTSANEGETFTFTITIHNTGDTKFSITELTDTNLSPLPANLQELIGMEIPVDGSLTRTYTIVHNDAGTYPNTAEVKISDVNGKKDFDNESVTVTVNELEVQGAMMVFGAEMPQTGDGPDVFSIGGLIILIVAGGSLWLLYKKSTKSNS